MAQNRIGEHSALESVGPIGYKEDMDLSAEIFRTRGRAPKPISAAVVRELDSADMILLSTEKGSTPSAIKRITDRHHALARCLAGGMAEGDAAVLQGYTISRVSILKSDPAFKELLQFYREDALRPYRDLHIRLSGLATDATVLLQEKLEADLELEVEDRKVPVNQLMELTKMGADRTGFGPQATNVNVNVDLAGRLEAARKRVAMRKLTVIEGGKDET
jgi:hypothetical protein